ncbi:hypothetical protein HNR15_003607, partial [Allobranchiibius huperziae]
MVAWTSPEAWLEQLRAALLSPEGIEATATDRIRAATVLDVAAVEARAANARTGRDVCTAHETVATVVGCSVATVRRARAVLQRIGYAVTLTPGRYLTAAERLEANAT